MAVARALPNTATALESRALVASPILGRLLVAALRALLLDPGLVVVTENGWWLEVDRWDA